MVLGTRGLERRHAKEEKCGFEWADRCTGSPNTFKPLLKKRERKAKMKSEHETERPKEEKQAVDDSAVTLIPLLSTVFISTGLRPAGCRQHLAGVHFN